MNTQESKLCDRCHISEAVYWCRDCFQVVCEWCEVHKERPMLHRLMPYKFNDGDYK